MSLPMPFSLRRRLAASSMAGFAFCAVPAHAQSNLLVNGSFEDATGFVDNGPTFGDQIMNLNAGATTLTGWTVVNGDVAWAAGTAYGLSTPFGTHAVDLTGYEMTAFGGLRQTFATTAGERYTLRFYLGAGGDLRAYSGPNIARASLLDGSTTLASQEFSSAFHEGRPTQWDAQSLSFVATSGSTTLLLQGVAPAASQFIGIDNVSVSLASAVPEPQSFALLLAGLGLLSATRRRAVR